MNLQMVSRLPGAGRKSVKTDSVRNGLTGKSIHLVGSKVSFNCAYIGVKREERKKKEDSRRKN